MTSHNHGEENVFRDDSVSHRQERVRENKMFVFAFTLAEVLIVLGIIGLIADMTLPTLHSKIQNQLLKVQFKKTYAMLNQVYAKTKADLGYNPECYLWKTAPHGGYHGVYDENGNSIGWAWNDGTPAAQDPNPDGHVQDCSLVKRTFIKNLKIIKYCPKNAYEGGCIPAYNGADKILRDSNPDISDTEFNKQGGNGESSTGAIRTKKKAYVLADSTIILLHPADEWPVYTIDVNGGKKPNKWGYDIFSFSLRGNNANNTSFQPYGQITEKGGKSTTQMLIDSLK